MRITRRAIATLPMLAFVVACSSVDPTEPQPFELYTHYGIDRSLIEFDGSFWEAQGPGQLSDGSGNPPPGFDKPFDRGSITLVSSDAAVFVSRRGIRIELVRLDNRPDLVPCR